MRLVNRIQAGGLSISALLITLALAGLLLGSGIPLHAGDNLEPEPTETPGATVTGTPEATASVTAAATTSATATSEAEMTPTATLASKVTASPVPTLSPRVYSQFLPYLTWYPPNNPPNCVPVAPLIATDPGAEQTITTALNNYRAGAGLQQLKVYPQIANAARRHAADMVDNAFVGHSGSDGSTVGERLTAACLHGT
ncbi:MAG: CAP domain-containing protein, partial [Candidatus Promineifilaceae bacterium]